jgi:hypothetical protein
VRSVLRALDERVALDPDVAHLMAALPALARTLRYGDVRGTDTSALRGIAEGLLVRICVGLPPALVALDDDAANAMRQGVDAVHAAVALLDRTTEAGGAAGSGEAADAGGASSRDRWLATVGGLAGRDDIHGVLSGRFNRLLLDAGHLPVEEARRRLGLTLTVGVPPARGAAWIEGFLAGGGLLLVHDERLLTLVDAWLAAIPADTFVEVLPLLRRTFSEFTVPERRAVGQQARRLEARDASGPGPGGDRSDRAEDREHDPERGALVLPTVALLLGWDIVPAPAGARRGAERSEVAR